MVLIDTPARPADTIPIAREGSWLAAAEFGLALAVEGLRRHRENRPIAANGRSDGPQARWQGSRRLFFGHPINPKVLVGRGVRERLEQRQGKGWRARSQVLIGDGPIADQNGVMLPGQGDGFGQATAELGGRQQGLSLVVPNDEAAATFTFEIIDRSSKINRDTRDLRVARADEKSIRKIVLLYPSCGIVSLGKWLQFGRKCQHARTGIDDKQRSQDPRG